MSEKKNEQVERLRRYASLIEKQTGKAVRPYRADGYVNMINRYGTQEDTSEQYRFQPEPAVSDDYLSEFYRRNGLFAKIIDTPAEEAIRHGFSLKDVKDDKVVRFYQEALEELDWEETALNAIRWTRLFGGSIAVMLINDGKGIDEPLDWKNIQSIDDIRVYDRSVIQPDTHGLFSYNPNDPFRTRGSRLGMPEYYNVFSKYGSFRVHDSRCLVFQNGILPENCSNSIYEMWGMPEYVRLRRAIRDTEIAHSNGPKLLEKSVQAVYKMQGLASLLSTTEGEDLVLKRLQVIDMARGLLNSIAIDSEGEDYDFRTFQFSGVGEVISASCSFLSALSNIPQTILFGSGVGGMSSTDDTSMENWYNYVDRIRGRMLKKNLRYLLSVIFQAGVATGEIEEVPRIEVEFAPLWSLSELEQATLEQTRANTQQVKANTAQIYVNMQAIDPSEVRKKLSETEDFDVENMLDDVDEEDLFAGIELGQEAGDPPADEGSDVEPLTAKETSEIAGNGNSPDAAPAATKLPQDMTDEEKLQKAAKGLPNGDSGDTEKPADGGNPMSVGVIVVSDGKILTGTRHNDFGHGLICGPGGHIEKGEIAESAAIRETEEEFGIIPKNLTLLGYGPLEPDTGLTPAIFLCTEWVGEIECKDLEITAPKFRTMEEIEQLDASVFQPFKDGISLMETVLGSELKTTAQPDAEQKAEQAAAKNKNPVYVHGGGTLDGGPGSGNHGHEGVPGQVGGSAPGNGGRAEVEGKDISRSHTGSRKTRDVLKAQGFDGLPKVVTKSEFDAAVQQSGFVAQRTYTASSQDILDQYRAQLYNGDFYVDCTEGGAQYGQGMYCAADYTGEITDGMKHEMDHYRQLGEERARLPAQYEHIKSLDPDTLRSSKWMRNVDVSDEEMRVFLKLNSDPNMTGYQLPADEQKVWRKMVDDRRWRSLRDALNDEVEKFHKSFKAPSYTETMTLSPTAKIVKYSEITWMQQNEGNSYLESVLADYAASKGKGCEAFFRIQTGRTKKGDYDAAIKWKDSSPDEFEAAESFRVKSVTEAQEMTKSAMAMDVGAYAAMKGFDAINAEGHGETGSYTVILNRTKTIIFGDSEQTDSKSKNAITFKEGDDGILYAFQNGKVIGWIAVAQSDAGDK